MLACAICSGGGAWYRPVRLHNLYVGGFVRDPHFVVSGAEKVSIVRTVLEGTSDVPERSVQPVNGNLWWMFDRAAAPV